MVFFHFANWAALQLVQEEMERAIALSLQAEEVWAEKMGDFSGKHGGFRWEHYGNMLIYDGHYRQNGDYI